MNSRHSLMQTSMVQKCRRRTAHEGLGIALQRVGTAGCAVLRAHAQRQLGVVRANQLVRTQRCRDAPPLRLCAPANSSA